MDLNTLCIGCFAEKNSRHNCSQCDYQEGIVPESVLHLPPGTGLQDKYLLGRVLGQGGFGITYLAWDQKLNLKLAIKEYFPQELAFRAPGSSKVSLYKQSLAQQFTYGLEKYLEEARTLARFAGHPNIVWVRDYFEANDTAYIVMEYIKGVTLKDYLAKKGAPLPIKQASAIFMPVLDALKEVHNEGILHRDISPDNILLSDRGRVVLIDFGAARQAIGEQSRSLSVIMKPGYSPEEQYYSKGKQGPWTDIYAVGASLYRTITGITPPESLSRLSDDRLILPSQLGFTGDPHFEEALMKAMAVKAKDRYRSVEAFQTELSALNDKGQASKDYTGIRSKQPGSLSMGPQAASTKERRRKTSIITAIILFCGLLIFGAFSLFGESDSVVDPASPGLEESSQAFSKVDSQEERANINDDRAEIDETEAVEETEKLPQGIEAVDINDESAGIDVTATESGTVNEGPSQSYNSAVIVDLDAEYYIDYDNGTTFVKDLPIGVRVVDPSWQWEFRTGDNYSGSGIVKPVTWIIVAKNHYDGLGSHITLLSEELIGKYTFDNSTNRSHTDPHYGYNHWGDSGTADATRGLRPFLNSTGIHSGEGFYRFFSRNFKIAVLTTPLPNRNWESGNAYSTSDHVFIPSSTELGDSEHKFTYQIGNSYPYFSGASNAKRVAWLGVEKYWYWTRSPDFEGGRFVRIALDIGDYKGINAYHHALGVRPALNLKADTPVSEIIN